MNYAFYKSENVYDLLKSLTLRALSEKYKISIVCENISEVSEISQFFWNNSIPHWIILDPFFEENNIKLDTQIFPADLLIVVNDAKFDLKKNEYKKIFFVGKNNYSNIDGNYWIYKNKNWHKITKEEYFLD